MELAAIQVGAWELLLAGLAVLLSVLASGHAVLYKRDSRAAVAWVGFIWFVPLIGALLYFVLGINRLRRHAVFLRAGLERFRAEAAEEHRVRAALESKLPAEVGHLSALACLADRVLDRSLVEGNRVSPLIDGDGAYPPMQRAIEEAQKSISLATYIFDNDPVGRDFVARLRDAVQRGVQVRVLLDDTGARYSWPSIVGPLKRARVPVARFLPTRFPFKMTTLNLRNHRKILVVDGRLGFTGGINIRIGHALARKPRRPARDIQFRVEGPVVAHLQEVFAEDWLFTTGEALRGESWFPPLSAQGPALARGIADGPDEDFEKLRWVLLGALACARSRVQILTPYFLPDQSVISAINVAARRGVSIDLILPEKSNLPFMTWATLAQLWQVLEHGCRVWLTPLPFDHSKFMVVDGYWSLVGSANWDARSLRLNFEFDLECYDPQLADELGEIARAKMAAARQLHLSDVDRRPLAIRLRDGVARLFAPYL